MMSQRRRILCALAVALVCFLSQLRAHFWEMVAPLWSDWVLTALINGVLCWLLVGGPWPVLKKIPDAPQHQHSLSLRYTGVFGLVVVCDVCHEKFDLHEDVRRTMVAVLLGLLFLFRLLVEWLPVRLWGPYRLLEFYLYWLPAVYVGQLLCWLYMRRRDPMSFLSAEARASLRANEAEG